MPRWTLPKWLQMPGAGRGRLQGRAVLSNMHVVTCIAACKGTFSSIANKEAMVALTNRPRRKRTMVVLVVVLMLVLVVVVLVVVLVVLR